MIPVTVEFTEEKTMPSYGYAIKEGRINGFVDNKESVVQSIYKRLMTEKYSHEIYTSDYGIQTSDLFENGADYAASVIEERIRESLEKDDRIENISNFEISMEKESISVEFEVETIFGKGKIRLVNFISGVL